MPASLMSETSLTYSNRVSPWHQLGTPMPADKDGCLALEALEYSHTDYTVYKQPRFNVLPDGSIREVTDQYDLYREPAPMHGYEDYDWIGQCSSRYHLLQNRDIARILDESGITQAWPVETMGALGRGERFFVTLRSGGFKVAGEDHIGYVSVLDNKDGGAALKIVESVVCVVCANTYAAADASATMTAAIPHGSKIALDFAWKATLFRQVQEQQRSFAEIAQKFARSAATPDLVALTLDAVFPLPKPPKAISVSPLVDHASDIERLVHKELIGQEMAVVGTVGDVERKYLRAKVRVQARREAVEREFDLTNQERPKIAGTAWALFNAFTGAIDHGVAPGTRRDVAARAERVTIGDDAQLKVTAFNTILANVN
jgi:hypothetical protein